MLSLQKSTSMYYGSQTKSFFHNRPLIYSILTGYKCQKLNRLPVYPKQNDENMKTYTNFQKYYLS